MTPATAANVAPTTSAVVYANNSSTGANGTVTLTTGSEGQRLVAVNNDAQFLPLVSASGTGNVLPGYAVRLIYIGGAWRRES